jgi:hypothetical protein
MSALGVEWLLLNGRCVRAVCTAPFPALVIQPRQAKEELPVLVTSLRRLRNVLPAPNRPCCRSPKWLADAVGFLA